MSALDSLPNSGILSKELLKTVEAVGGSKLQQTVDLLSKKVVIELLAKETPELSVDLIRWLARGVKKGSIDSSRAAVILKLVKEAGLLKLNLLPENVTIELQNDGEKVSQLHMNKSLLILSSAYFRAMFSSQFQEATAQNGKKVGEEKKKCFTVLFKDYSRESLQLFKRFVHGDEVRGKPSAKTLSELCKFVHLIQREDLLVKVRPYLERAIFREGIEHRLQLMQYPGLENELFPLRREAADRFLEGTDAGIKIDTGWLLYPSVLAELTEESALGRAIRSVFRGFQIRNEADFIQLQMAYLAPQSDWHKAVTACGVYNYSWFTSEARAGLIDWLCQVCPEINHLTFIVQPSRRAKIYTTEESTQFLVYYIDVSDLKQLVDSIKKVPKLCTLAVDVYSKDLIAKGTDPVCSPEEIKKLLKSPVVEVEVDAQLLSLMETGDRAFDFGLLLILRLDTSNAQLIQSISQKEDPKLLARSLASPLLSLYKSFEIQEGNGRRFFHLVKK